MLPELIEPKKLAQEHRVLQGEIPIDQFTRAQGLFEPSSQNLWFSWSFSLDHLNQIFGQLQLKAQLKLKCQACYQDFDYSLEVMIPMQHVRTEVEAEAMPLEIQPLYLDAEGHCNPFEIIEDELILNIPEFPRHEKKDCSFYQNKAQYDTLPSGKDVNTHKPFANLKLLTKTQTSSTKEKK